MDLLSDLWATMLNLVYSGNAGQAYQLYHMAYPDHPDLKPKDQMLEEFERQLAKSHFRPKGLGQATVPR